MRFIKRSLIALAVLAVIGAVLYQFFGLRVVLRGDGTPRLAFVKSADARAAEIEQHRASQRASAVPTSTGAAGAVPIPAVPAPLADGAASIPSTAPAPVSALTWTGFRGPARDGIYR